MNEHDSQLLWTSVLMAHKIGQLRSHILSIRHECPPGESALTLDVMVHTCDRMAHDLLSVYSDWMGRPYADEPVTPASPTMPGTVLP